MARERRGHEGVADLPAVFDVSLVKLHCVTVQTILQVYQVGGSLPKNPAHFIFQALAISSKMHARISLILGIQNQAGLLQDFPHLFLLSVVIASLICLFFFFCSVTWSPWCPSLLALFVFDALLWWSIFFHAFNLILRGAVAFSTQGGRAGTAPHGGGKRTVRRDLCSSFRSGRSFLLRGGSPPPHTQSPCQPIPYLLGFSGLGFRV
jgi:hypothetical protein